MKLSVIILNYNVRYFLELSLRSVLKAVMEVDAEIIVVDNASSDGSIEMVRQLFPEVGIIENSENIGFAKANNRAVAQALGEYICILNPDTVVPEDFFAKILDRADSRNNLGIMGCRLIDGSGKFLPESKRNVPTTRVSFRKLMGDPKLYYAQHIDENDSAEVDILVGAMMLMKKSVFNEVNGFDEDYFMYAEDVDLSYKVLKARYKNWYNGKETIIHFKGESTLKDKNYLKRFYGAMQIFYKKHFRKNLLFDFMVWMAIKTVPIFKANPNKEKSIRPHNYILVTDNPEKFNLNLKDQNLSFKNKIIDIDSDTQYIFDVTSNSYKYIVKTIGNSGGKNNASFRFFVPESNFVIGSDSSEGRGEVTPVI